ncbi:serine/threonine protein kinase [Pseudomonas sp. ABC1]|uniref:serine/threonine protein kinase n=1 Tax=Pseudomonas sp. ABC1 TaxID=2748080 RepID=UPI0015C3BE43|nr:serine/threonine protein kinase [Pseudomonas sp. ABC1]QLF93251.1 serine/threonine protein kinase [Pseudomonas sp. ABC1]
MSHPFDALSPDLVLDAVESLGYLSDARVLALNSYENRVYQVGIEDETPLVAKFYRPQRWSDAAILEEHQFSQELADRDIPVVAPLQRDGRTLFEHAGFRFALFPRRGGRAPEPGDADQLYRLGQLLGRLHAVGASHPFAHRERLTPQLFGHDALATLLEGGFIPGALLADYRALAQDLLARVDALFAATPHQTIRLHGDCHPGNILVRDDAMYLVDLDDCRSGPAVQDLWMMLSGERHERTAQLAELLEGYGEFHDFNPRELALIEGLRTLRMLHYSAWLARRWDDPAFPASFPWFGSEHYWREQIQILSQQRQALEQQPLQLFP